MHDSISGGESKKEYWEFIIKKATIRLYRTLTKERVSQVNYWSKSFVELSEDDIFAFLFNWSFNICSPRFPHARRNQFSFSYADTWYPEHWALSSQYLETLEKGKKCRLHRVLSRVWIALVGLRGFLSCDWPLFRPSWNRIFLHHSWTWQFSYFYEIF